MLRSYIRRLGGYVRRSSPWRIFFYLLSLVVASLGGAAVPLLFRRTVDEGLIPEQPVAALAWTGGALVFGLLAAAASAGSGFLGSAIGSDLTFELRRDLHHHLSEQPVAFFARSRSGAITSRITHDAIDAQSLIQSVLGTLVGQGLTLIVAIAAIMSLSPLAAVVTLAAAPLILIPVRAFGRPLRQAGRRQAQARSSVQQHVGEHLHSQGALAREIFGTRQRDQEAFETMASDMRRAVTDRNRYFYTSSFLLGTLSAVGVAAVYVIASVQGAAEVSVGTVVALAGLVQLMYQPLTQLATQGLGLNTAIVALERVFEVLDHDATGRHRQPGTLTVHRPVRELRLDHIWYRHPGPEITLPSLSDEVPDDSNDWTVRDLTLSLPRGITAIVGPTGAGKTTTALLAAGIYRPTRGVVRLDGEPLSDYHLASLRQAVAVISQDPFLLHASLRTNLQLGAPTATDDELGLALDVARLSDVIARLPAGLDTTVGDRGYRLSGGERQRLALARALLQRPDVIIMDEATAHLDVTTEQAISQAITTNLGGTIRLVIAHRLSTIRAADKIIVLDSGEIVQHGSHDQLSSVDGLYADLLRSAGSDAGAR